MARIALLRPDGEVDNVIVSEPGYAAELAARLGLTAREIVTELETPATSDAIVSRSCEPGARLVTRDATAAERSSGRARRVAGRDLVDDFAPRTEEPTGGEGASR